MFRSIGKSKIAIVLAIVFGISLFFIKGGSRYSNFLNSDNIVANVAGTSISTTKFNRTIQLNINRFNQMLNKKLTNEEIIAFQIPSLALGALINDAVFENEYDQQSFYLDKKIIAKKTKERLPTIYNNNKLNDAALSEFLRQESLTLDDLVRIIDYEARNKFFNEALFKIYYPKKFLKKIKNYEIHKRKIEYLKINLDSINLDNNNLANNITLEDYYINNTNQYMSQEKRSVEYIIINKKDFIYNYTPTNFDMKNYYENNKELYFENEKRSFTQFNFKNLQEAKDFQAKTETLTNNEIINLAQEKNLRFNSFENLSEKDILSEISNVLFKLKIGEKSKIIETPLAKHVLILDNINQPHQLDFNQAKEKIKNTLISIELDNFYNDLNNQISRKILEGNSIKDIANEFNLELKKINDLTKNYFEYEDNEKIFYNSLITNSFAANKDFLSDTIKINQDSFYIFNVTEIEFSEIIELNKIKDQVFKDWEKSKKINMLNKVISINENNVDYIYELSNKYNQVTQKVEIDSLSTIFPKNLLSVIFKNKKNSLVHSIEKNDLYVAKIADIIIDQQDIESDNSLLLMNDIRGSFGQELLKKVNVSTNNNLINALLEQY